MCAEMPTRYLARLGRAADALKEGIDERNAAGLAIARAQNEIERIAAIMRHERAYNRLEELKRALIEAAVDTQDQAATG
jgi:hypothetical protein